MIPIMLLVLGVLALGLSLYPLTYWKHQLVQGDAYWDIAVEKVYPLQWIGVIMMCIGAILVVIGILKAKSEVS